MAACSSGSGRKAGRRDSHPPGRMCSTLSSEGRGGVADRMSILEGRGGEGGRVCLECKHTPAHSWGRAAEECELRLAPVSGIMYSDVWMNHLASTLGRVDKRRCPPCLPEIEYRRNCGGTIATVLTIIGRMQPHSAASDKGSSYRRAGTRTHEPPSIGAGCTMVRPCAAARMGTAIE